MAAILDAILDFEAYLFFQGHLIFVKISYILGPSWDKYHIISEGKHEVKNHGILICQLQKSKFLPIKIKLGIKKKDPDFSSVPKYPFMNQMVFMSPQKMYTRAWTIMLYLII